MYMVFYSGGLEWYTFERDRAMEIARTYPGVHSLGGPGVKSYGIISW